jgi:hypothetical protein
MHDPNPKYRPSLIEENPALLIWLLLLASYLVFVFIAKYAWYIHDDQILEFTLWLLLAGLAIYLCIHQFTQARRQCEQAWPNQLQTIQVRTDRRILARAWDR